MYMHCGHDFTTQKNNYSDCQNSVRAGMRILFYVALLVSTLQLLVDPQVKFHVHGNVEGQGHETILRMIKNYIYLGYDPSVSS